jgi:hypothetical protein
MSRIAKASITFLFNLDEDPLFEMDKHEWSDEQKLTYFKEMMAEDLIVMCHGSGAELINAIEMEITNARL